MSPGTTSSHPHTYVPTYTAHTATMVHHRPTHLDLSGAGFADSFTRRSPMTSPGDLAPPRPGDIPPALSPLDAFRMQSMLLAKKFEEEQDNGKRLSRLPPLTVQNEFSRRPPFMRNTSSETSSAADESPIVPDNSERGGNMGRLREVEERERPMSTHPTLEGDVLNSHKPHKPSLTGIGEEQEFVTPDEVLTPSGDYFHIPRASSPDAIEPTVTIPTPDTPRTASVHLPTSPQADNFSIDSLSIASPKQSLKPPRSPMAMTALKNSPSIRSVYDSSDDVEAFSMTDSVDSLPPRKPSTNSSYSRSQSPAVFNAMPMPRSPSVASESSWTSLPRPSFNFSRPRSAMGRPSLDLSTSHATSFLRQGTMDSTSTRPSLDVPSRQATGDTPLTPMSMDMPRTPLTVASEDYFTADSDEPGQAYTYSKYSLPRGRPMNRESIAPGDFILRQFEWDSTDLERASPCRSPSPHSDRIRIEPPMTPPQSNSPQRFPIQRSVSSDETREPPRTGSPHAPRFVQHKSNNSTPAASSNRPSIAGSMQTASSSASASTIKAHLMHTKSPSTETTAEQHLQKGIELHEQGKLQESTYHLRTAANARLPTAMLLYALACRHGWGMRPSQSEGVMWLQRAVDSMQLEVADDEHTATSPGGAAPDAVDKRSHKAQFALSVYELGMSYMNGWGVRQDRALGLRCFEVAGNWGDADALAEAAFCYAEGVGAKKDLKRAARLYRDAERRGMSMAGNSWYVSHTLPLHN